MAAAVAAATGLLAGAASVGAGAAAARLTRNDQLLTGRQRARPLVAVGLQDRGGRNVVAARQCIERIAGADDDRGAGLGRPVGRRDRARGDGAGGLDRLMRGRSIGGEPAPSSGHAGTRGRIGLRRRDRRRQGWDWYCDCGRAYCGSSRRSTAGVRHRAGGFRLRGKGIGKGILREPRRHVGAAAGKTERHQRQHRDVRYATRAKQLDDTGHGYSLVRNKILF